MKKVTLTTVMSIFMVLFCTILTATPFQKAQAQPINNVMEISWHCYGINYSGLMITYTDDTGHFIVNYYLNNVGYIRVWQSIDVSRKYDAWGNCTTFLIGYDAESNPPVPYSPDSFIIYPNGSMYTQDTNGVWSTLITAKIIPKYQWDNALRKYGIDI